MVAESSLLFGADEAFQTQALVSGIEKYREMYNESIDDPEKFWANIGERDFFWQKKWDAVCNYNFDLRKGPIHVEWFIGGKTNVCYNAVDRHVADKGDQTAILWEGNHIGEDSKMTYSELLEQVCRFANVLKSKGIGKGDRVAIYMPMIAELVIAMLACARIGAVHTVVFGGFSAGAISLRILDAKARVVVTADGVFRGNKPVKLKQTVDEAVKLCSESDFTVETVIVYKRLGKKCPVSWNDSRDVWWGDAVAKADSHCDPEWMDAEDPLFMLYTSGSTGSPKGVLHTTGGYMVYASTTFKYIFDYHPGDIWWCTADCGWITGHSYITYGPLCAGATTLVFEGVPNFPDAGRFWAVIDKYKVTQFYTAPTAIRALMREGEEIVKKYSRKSLKVLGSVGEPINPDAWLWYYNVVGDGRCPIVDTWWQTETGGIMITALPGAIPMKPGSATLPFFGATPAVLDDKGNEVEGPGAGYLVIKKPWPGIMRTVYGDHARYEQTYFANYKGYYFTGDGCLRDADGYFWITGRVDDVINVSGHRIGSAEVENALVHHPAVAEAAVVGYPHEIKGQGIFCFVTPKAGFEPTVDQLKAEVRKELGPYATPDVIILTTALPKTRSGKIMRRILRKIACDEADSLGDVSTLADPKVVEVLISLCRR